MDNKTTITELKNLYKNFCEERDWDQFHNPKDLAIGIVTEASELLQLFRFKSVDEVEMLFKTNKREEIEDELADIMLFILRLAEKKQIDLSEAIKNKLYKNAKKYPISLAKGSNKKYNEF